MIDPQLHRTLVRAAASLAIFAALALWTIALHAARKLLLD